jgi:hypothetical protein
MKPSLMLLILLLIVSSACRTTGQVNKEPQETGHKYSKIEQFYTPVENGTPIAAKRKPYSERQFDNNGNLTEFIFRPYETFEKSVNTYKYENNRRVEQMDDGIRTLCTFTSPKMLIHKIQILGPSHIDRLFIDDLVRELDNQSISS